MAGPVMIFDKPAQEVLETLDYGYPVALLIFFLLAFVIHSVYTAPKAERVSDKNQLGPGGKPLPRKRQRRGGPYVEFSPVQQSLFRWISALLTVTFAADAALVVIHVIADRNQGWWCGQPFTIYVVGSFFLYAILLISLVDTKPSPTPVHGGVWLLALILEILRAGSKLALYTSTHREHAGKHPEGETWRNSMSDWEGLEVAIEMTRLLLLSGLVLLYSTIALWQRRRGKKSEAGHILDSETTSLLEGHHENGQPNGQPNGHAYGATTPVTPSSAAWSRPDKMPTKSWWEYLRGYSLFLPYLWPSKSRRLQVYFVICFILVCTARFVNIAAPHQVGILTNALAGTEDREPYFPIGGICLYIFLRFMQGNNGLLGAIRNTLWIPISQYSYQELSTAAFEHVHSLSLQFHLDKKTGEVLSALSKGNSINTFLEQVTFQMCPMLVDLVFAFAYFLYEFDAYYALVVAIVAFLYLYVTIRMAQWRADARREMANLSRNEDAVKNDSMVSYETVKYFNAEQYEFGRYRTAVQKFQNQEYIVLLSLNIMNIVQNTVFTLGLMIVCFIVAYQISIGKRTVGDFSTLVIYMAQLQAPLNFFGTFYRSVQYAMINAERMLELFKEQPTVLDDPDATELPSCEGEIRYNDVKFSYDPRRDALKDVSFTCSPGTTTALVGESGGGKSTIFRLLFRFYNCQEGSIQIDGQDVKALTIDSLRRHIGVVPQDTVLFNETIMYNLKYANPDATDEEVFDACRAASIHDRILTFPDGYEARVGERGLKLSGGEKQRVAIARTILKNPRIILLDEATAALDTETENNIQEALQQLSKGRTTLVIAHRLSTITNADQILVLSHGEIAESGTHPELIEKDGKYASMWRRQIKAQRAAAEAKVLTDRAERWPNEAHSDESAPQSDDEHNLKKKQQRPQSHGPSVSSDSHTMPYHAHHGSVLPPGHP